MGSLNRRDFLKAFGLTGAVSTAAACGFDDNIYYTPIEQVLPYVVRPEQTTPGTPTFFATTTLTGPKAFPVTARHRDGRVVHVSGNKLAPGRASVPAMSLFDLQRHYSPDRYSGPREGESEISWDDGLAKLAKAVKQARNQGKTVAYLGPYRSGAIVDLLKTYTKNNAIFWEPMGRAAEASASKQLFGKRMLPSYELARAHYVLSFGADLLGTWGSNRERADYSRARNPNKGHFVARFALVSPHRGQTGANADDFFGCIPGSEALVALAVAKLVAEENKAKPRLKKLVAAGDPAAAAAASGLTEDDIKGIAKQFAAHKGVALPGGVAGASAAGTDLAVATMLLNLVSGHHLMQMAGYLGPVDPYRKVKKLIEDMNAGKVAVLLLDDINPVYSLPTDAGFDTALAKVGLSVGLSSHPDETNASVSMILPSSDSFEDWGDEQIGAGLHLLRQPAMSPLGNTRSLGDILLASHAAAGAKKAFSGSWHAFLKQQWKEALYPTQLVWDEAGEEGRIPKPKLTAIVEAWKEESGWNDEVAGKGGKGKGKGKGPDAEGKAGKGKGAKGKGAKGKGAKGKGAKGKGGKADAPELGPDGLPLPPVEPPKPKQKFARWWEGRLHDGFYTSPLDQAKFAPDLVQGASAKIGGAPAMEGGDYYLHVYPHPLIFDGRYANQPWAQEVPDPMTGFVWDTWVLVHPTTCAALGVGKGDLVEISTAAGKIEVGVLPYEGIREDVVAVPAGNGHTVGRYAEGTGSRVSDLLTTQLDSNGALVWQQGKASVKATGRKSDLISTFGHDTDEDRNFAVLVDADKLGKVGDEEVHDHHDIGKLTGIHHLAMDPRLAERGKNDFYGMPAHPNYRFGMTVDTNACTGCGACSVACYAENNLPVVGKHKVKEGREMSWIRINRYYKKGETVFVPMMCQQCGHAPCESVCPVLATYHTIDGLNAMVYNRCAGTRYCSNACPYSVRKFNYHTYVWPEPFNLMLNPDVVTRTMGVMEKCTFCVQRIRRVKSAYRDKGFDRLVPDKALRKLPACADVCPTDALTFGNIDDKKAVPHTTRHSQRHYEPLAELNVMPAINYLAKASFHNGPALHHGGGHGDDGHGDDSHGKEEGGHHG